MNQTPFFRFEQKINQLDRSRGGYYYLKIEAQYVQQFEKGRATQLICRFENGFAF